MLTAAEAANEGELDLFVECAWRLERGDEVVCGSTDDNRNDGPMVTGLSLLIEKTVNMIEISTPVPDVNLHFAADLCLRIFCDQTNLETNRDNYSVRVGDTIIAVAARGPIVIEKRQSD